jgi:EamA-like transporter family
VQKPVLGRVPAFQVTWLGCVIATVVCLPFAPALVSDAGGADPSAVAWTAYLGAVPTALGFATWSFALRRTSAGRMGRSPTSRRRSRSRSAGRCSARRRHGWRPPAASSAWRGCSSPAAAQDRVKHRRLSPVMPSVACR